jgi:hypothetical protein
MVLLFALGCLDATPMRPPPPPVVDGVVLVEGAGGRVDVVGVPAGRLVHLVGAVAAGRTCPAVLGGSCVDLAAPTYLGATRADANGDAVFALPFAPPDGSTVRMQAVVLTAGAADVSAVAVATVGDGDADTDGLRDAEELALGTDPFDPDTDGGGTLDGEEAQFSDPLDPTDDAPERICDDGLDGDGDGAVDCEEAFCLDAPGCTESDCDDGADNDDDGLADCDDDDCWSVDCHDVAFSWVTGGTLSVDQYTSFDNVAVLFGVVAGRAYVNGPRTGPRVCGWTALRDSVSDIFGVDSLYPGITFFAEPGCELGDDVLPAIDDLRMTPYGVYTDEGLRYVGTSMDARDSESLAIYGLVPGVPNGFCPGGAAPLLRWYDGDGDGYGVSASLDRWGSPGGTVWSCAPLPGTTDRGGDCDDDDPTWTPLTVVLAPGSGCSDATPLDRDGDGVDDTLDATPNDGRTP